MLKFVTINLFIKIEISLKTILHILFIVVMKLKNIYLPNDYITKKIVQCDDLDWVNTINLKNTYAVTFEKDWEKFLEDSLGIKSDGNLYNIIRIKTYTSNYVLRTTKGLQFIERILNCCHILAQKLKLSLIQVEINDLTMFQNITSLKFRNCIVKNLGIQLPSLQKVHFDSKNMLDEDIIDFIHLNPSIKEIIMSEYKNKTKILEYLVDHEFITSFSLLTRSIDNTPIIAQILENNQVLEIFEICYMGNKKVDKYAIKINKLGKKFKHICVQQAFDLQSLKLLIENNCEGYVDNTITLDDIFNLRRDYPNSKLVNSIIKNIDKKLM